jgi:hypothetical protein
MRSATFKFGIDSRSIGVAVESSIVSLGLDKIWIMVIFEILEEIYLFEGC